MNGCMNSEPLTATEHLKVSASIILGFLVSWVLLFFGGFVPVIILAYGYIMSRKTRDFDHVEVTVKIAKAYFRILLILTLIAAAALLVLASIRGTNFYSDVLQEGWPGQIWNDYEYWFEYYGRWLVAAAPFGLSVLFYLCILAIQHLYYLPLQAHKEWVSEHGLFSKKQRVRRGMSSAGIEAAPDE